MIRLLKILGSIRLAIVCMILLIVLVFLGTLYQHDYGLYLSQEKFFYSWIVWFDIGGVPVPLLPGGALVMTVFTVCLTISMLVHFTLGWRKAGLWLAHIGVLLMMVGGAYTKMTGIESYLNLAEGQASNLSADYREWEFSLWTGTNEVRDVYAVDAKAAVGAPVAFPDLGVTLRVDTYHRNARAMVHKTPPAGIPFSVSGITELEPARADVDPQKDMPGGIVTLTAGAESRQVLLFSGDELPTPVTVGGREVFVNLRRVRYPLPVLVKLNDFRKETYANSSMAEAFSSQVTVTLDDKLERDVKIEMNKPFRHLGWTFFQASFTEDGRGQETSTFAVTRNFGRLIPYFATGITFIGMMVHFALGWVPRREGDRS